MNTEKKRQDIIRTGMDLFIQNGFAAVSVEDICRKLNISKPTLYKYVRKKEMILSAYYQQQTVDSLPEVYALLKQGRPAAALQTMFEKLCQIATTMGPELYAAYRIYTLSDKDYLALFSRPQVRVLELCIRDLQNTNIIPSTVTPHKLAVILMDLYEGAALTWASHGGEFDLQKKIQTYIRVTLGIT